MSEPVLPGVLPCPFCGSVVPDIVVTEDYRQQYGVQCDACGAGLYHYRTPVGAIDDWNRRPGPPELTERQRAILAAADALCEAQRRVLNFNRYDTSRAAGAAYDNLAAATSRLTRAACQEPTTTNGRDQEAGDAD